MLQTRRRGVGRRGSFGTPPPKSSPPLGRPRHGCILEVEVHALCTEAPYLLRLDMLHFLDLVFWWGTGKEAVGRLALIVFRRTCRRENGRQLPARSARPRLDASTENPPAGGARGSRRSSTSSAPTPSCATTDGARELCVRKKRKPCHLL